MSLPQFSAIDVASIEQQLNTILNNNRKIIQSLIKNPECSWAGLMTPLEDCDEAISLFWAPIGHLHSVADSPELRQAYDACIPLLSLYASEMGQCKELYEATLALKESDEYHGLSTEQKKIIENHIRDYELCGVHLNDDDKKTFQELSQELAMACNQFEQHVLDATSAFHFDTDDEAMLEGLPEQVRQLAKQRAEEADTCGYRFTIDGPTFMSVMQFSAHPQLRETLYRAFVTRASDQGPHANQFNNQATMEKILELRSTLAQLLDFDHYAQYSLATKMLKQPQQVLDFLQQLVAAARPQAEQEFKTLCNFSQQHLDLPTLQAWDIAYASEQYRRHLFDISDEMLRPYFPLEQVLQGLFEISHQLFQIQIEALDDVDTWHDDVRAFALNNEKGERIAAFYLDLITRPSKRSGAWMDDCQSRRERPEGLQIPIAFINTNVSPAVSGQPVLLTHYDVITLFHEFGHSLQHMLTTINHVDVAGINGVPWDAVEVASQWMENFAWDQQCLSFFSKHYQNDEPLPDALYQKMIAARNFQSGLQMLRQLEFSLFDFRLHMEFDPKQSNPIQSLLDDVRAQVAVIQAPDFNRFQHSFSHIFAGGYAAGYYSYKWAEVMAQDAFSLFVEKGTFDPTTSQRFRQTFLEQGGAREPMDLFVEFRGRQPNIDALLEHAGIES